MMKMFLSLLIIIISIMMLFLNHPLSMGLMILMQTLLMCLMSGMIIKTYWFSYILFLTFLGGLLVLFIYISSIASNEMFKLLIKIKLLTFFLLLIMIIFNIMLLNNNLTWMNLSDNNLEMKNFFNMFLFFNNENKINLSKLYNNQTFLMMMMMMIYLFITLIAVVKITNIFYGPLRSSIN
uniref:NADH-ubiquinone oxidoreductase chain 6 n=1 Tax=Chilo suppressalis TaxID=168631 RepID=F6LPU2_CHISP|nr:NADH dehydrogenase subunit 6 [Chilo suppressalis]AEF33925.1 NADH dehydrogenase subunit 6 [Chilo suppressalis]